jgi:hypothetical protein
MSLWNNFKRKFYLGKYKNNKNRMTHNWAIDDIYPEDKAIINYLLNKYSDISNVDRFNLYTKLDMLKRTMEDLEMASAYDESETEIQREEQRLKDIDPEDIRIMEDELRRDSSVKTSSRIDYPHEDLPSDLWDKDGDKYSLKPELAETLHGIIYSLMGYDFNSPDEWITNLILASSITGQFWKAESDIDVKVAIDVDAFRKSNPGFENKDDEKIREDILAIFDEYKDEEFLNYGKHPIDLYPIFSYQLNDKELTKKLESIYDIDNNEWLKPVRKIDIDNYDRDDVIADGETSAMAWAQKWDLEIGDIRRKVKEFNLIEEYINSLDDAKASKLKKKMESIASIIKRDIDTIHLEKEIVKKLYYDSYKNYEEDLTDFYNVANAQPEVIRIKLLNLWGYLKIIRALNKIVKNKEEIKSKDVERIDTVISASLKISSMEESLADVGRYWISPKGKALRVDDDIHHGEWIAKHPEILNDQEKNWAAKMESNPDNFLNHLFADGWIRVSGFVAQMFNEFSMPMLARFLDENADDSQLNQQMTIIYSGNDVVNSMMVDEIIEKYISHEDDELLLQAKLSPRDKK